jgi:hypothetical protein
MAKSANDGMWNNHEKKFTGYCMTQNDKQSKHTVEQVCMVKVIHPLQSFEPHPFKMFGVKGSTIMVSKSP